jgi:hypothetical protein
MAAVWASVRSANRLASRRQAKGGNHFVCSTLRVRWRTDEHGRNGSARAGDRFP